MGRIIKFLLGLAVGAGVGYATGLLLSPESGEENLRQVRRRIDAAVAEGQRAAGERRRELEAELARARQPGVG
jgi:gas vesicle protein